MSGREVPDRRLPTIREVLAKVHLRATLLSVGMVGITVLLAGVLVIRSYANHNLSLIAQTASYTVEAALVFNDRNAAAEAIAPLTQTQGVGRLMVTDAGGKPIANWRRTGQGFGFALEQTVGRLAFPDGVVAPIRHEGREIGEVVVYGDAGGLSRFVAVGCLSVVACLLIAAIASILLARRLEEDIAAPLQAIAAVAHTVRGRTQARSSRAACGNRRDRQSGPRFQCAAGRAGGLARQPPIRECGAGAPCEP